MRYRVDSKSGTPIIHVWEEKSYSIAPYSKRPIEKYFGAYYQKAFEWAQSYFTESYALITSKSTRDTLVFEGWTLPDYHLRDRIMIKEFIKEGIIED